MKESQMSNKTDSIVSWSIHNLTRKPIILDGEKQKNFSRNIRRLINLNANKNKNDQITEKELEKEFKRDHRSSSLKKLQNFKSIIAILSKSRNERNKFDIRILSSFLSDKYDFFKKLKEEYDNDKLELCASILNLEIYEPGDKIIKYGDDATKFFIILQGVLSVYKPKIIEKVITLKEFVIYLNNIKNKEQNEAKINRIEEANERNINFGMIKLFNYDHTKLVDVNNKNTYFVEEDELLTYKNEGEEFGEIALLQNIKRTATIAAHTTCYVASIERVDYNHIIKKLEEKKFNAHIDEIRKSYRILSNWSKSLITKLMGIFAKFTMGYGDILYEQNAKADELFFTINGNFEFTTNININSFGSYVEHILNSKGNLLNHLKKESKVNENDIETLKENAEKLNGDFIMQKSESQMKTPIKNKNENLIDLKLKEDELKNGHAIFPVKIRLIEFRDILGLEEAIELKKRYYTIKCVSSRAEVYKVKLNDFLLLLNAREVRKSEIISFITERKEVLIKQLKNSVNIKIREQNRIIEHQYNRFLVNLELDSKRNEHPINGLKIHNTEFNKTFDFSLLKKDMKDKFEIKVNNLLNSPQDENPLDFLKLDMKEFKNSKSVNKSNSFLKKNDLNVNRKSRQASINTNFSVLGVKEHDCIFMNKSEKNIFDSKYYRKNLESKNFEDLTVEISKIVGNSLVNNKAKPKVIFNRLYDKKLVSINSMTNLQPISLKSKTRLLSSKKIETEESPDSKLIPHTNMYDTFSCLNSNNKVDKLKNIESHKKFKKIPNKKKKISMEIKMKYFKVLKKRRDLSLQIKNS